MQSQKRMFGIFRTVEASIPVIKISFMLFERSFVSKKLPISRIGSKNQNYSETFVGEIFEISLIT